jgi:ribosomal protein S13
MSGLEALSVACNVMQVISAAIKTISICRAIYHGDSTASGVLEEHAVSTMSSTSLLSKELRASHLQSPEVKELADLAQNCHDIAQKLQAEVQSVVHPQRKGSVSKAFFGAVKAHLRKSKMEELEERLNGYRTRMETHILVRL